MTTESATTDTAVTDSPPAADLDRKRAADLRTGDLIVPADLLGCTDRHVVLFAYRYLIGAGRDEGVLLVHHCADDPYPQVDYLYADDSIAVAAPGRA